MEFNFCNLFLAPTSQPTPVPTPQPTPVPTPQPTPVSTPQPELGTNIEVLNDIQIFSLDRATYSTIDAALNACSSARTGAKPHGAYFAPNFPFDCSGRVIVTAALSSCPSATHTWGCYPNGSNKYIAVGNTNEDCLYGSGNNFLEFHNGWKSTTTGELLCAVAVGSSNLIIF